MRGHGAAVLATTLVCFTACNALFGVDDLEIDVASVTSSTTTTGPSEGGAGGDFAMTTAVAMGGGGGLSLGTGGAGGAVCGVEVVGTERACPPGCSSCSEGTCVLDCQGESACFNIEIFCPLGWACRLQCNGRSACERARLHCTQDHSCSVDCDGSELRACHQLSLDCPAAATCDIHCGAQSSCRNAKVTCGADACRAACDFTAADEGPSLNCNEACLCEPC